MKKILYFLFFPLVLISCFASKESKPLYFEKNGKLKVLSTIAMIDQIVKEVGGEEIDTLCLIEGELDPHSYELLKGDFEKFMRADLIFCHGLCLEHGLSLQKELQNNSKVIKVAEMIYRENPTCVIKTEGQIDPHLWLDMALWSRIVDPVEKTLSSARPEKANYFHGRAEKLKEKLKSEDEEIFLKLQSIDEKKRYLVSSHSAFSYFARRYLATDGEELWQERAKAPEGLAPEAQVALSDLKAILEHLEKHQIHVVFSESNVNADCLKKIISSLHKKGFEVKLASEPLYSDAMQRDASYIEMMRHNATILFEEWKKDDSR